MKSVFRILVIACVVLTLQLSAQEMGSRERLLILKSAKIECKNSSPMVSITLDAGSFSVFGSNVVYTITGPNLSPSIVLHSSTAGSGGPSTHTFQINGVQHGGIYSIAATSGVIGGNTLLVFADLNGCNTITPDLGDQPIDLVDHSKDSTSCCPGENLIKLGDFENVNTPGFLSSYLFQQNYQANTVNAGMYGILNSSQAQSVSPQWLIQDPQCTPNGKFLIVNGANNQTNLKLVWEETVIVQHNSEYRFCAWMKDLPQCAFNMTPNIQLQFHSQNNPISTFNTHINVTGSNPALTQCVWQQVSHVVHTGGSASYPLKIQIWLAEVQSGDGNDLAIDNISFVRKVPLPSSFNAFTVTSSAVTSTTFQLTATPPALPSNDNCGYFWEVCEVDHLNQCKTGTTITNAQAWWTGTTKFPGYNGTSTLTPASSNGTLPPGVFEIGKRYKIRYGTWCDCKSWSQSVVIIEYNMRMHTLKVKEILEATSEADSHR